MNIELVKWTEDNKAALIRVCNEVDRRYLSGRLPYPYNEQCADWWYQNVVSCDGKTGVFRAVVVDGEVVGSILIEPKLDIYVKDCELGYMLLSEYHSRGIMTQATALICEIAFEQLDIERITACIMSDNIASQRVVQKNGFELEGVMKRGVFKDGAVSDLMIYGRLR